MASSEPRATVARLLRGSQAHAGLEKALEGFPVLLDHNAYHAGQLVALRVALGAWSPG